MSLLTTNQIHHLAATVLETFGSRLTEDELSEKIGLLLEDIAGFEAASDSDVQKAIADIGSHYHDACKIDEED